jgi:hypothetical protein
MIWTSCQQLADQPSRQPLVLNGHLKETVASLLVSFVLSPTTELSREIAVVRDALNFGQDWGRLGQVDPAKKKVLPPQGRSNLMERLQHRF